MAIVDGCQQSRIAGAARANFEKVPERGLHSSLLPSPGRSHFLAVVPFVVVGGRSLLLLPPRERLLPDVVCPARSSPRGRRCPSCEPQLLPRRPRSLPGVVRFPLARRLILIAPSPRLGLVPPHGWVTFRQYCPTLPVKEYAHAPFEVCISHRRKNVVKPRRLLGSPPLR